MDFGTGPLRGWTLTPGAREDRERTARGALLKLIHLSECGDLAQARTILEVYADEIVGAIYALADEFFPLHHPTPGEVAALGAMAPAPPAAEPPTPREELPAPRPPGASLSREEFLEAKKEEAGDSLWRRLLEDDPGHPSPGASCASCAKDVTEAAHRIRFDGIDLWAHPACALREAKAAQEAKAKPKSTEPPEGLDDAALRRWRVASTAVKRTAKPKTYKGESRACCELCTGQIEPGEFAKSKRAGSSKYMHEDCAAFVLAHPDQPLPRQQETTA